MILTLSSRREVATFVNTYPTLDVSHELLKGDYTAGAPIALRVSLEHDVDKEDSESAVAPFYPLKKVPNWWLVVGDSESRQLLAIKKVQVTIPRSLVVKLEFSLPVGTPNLKLYAICDSYMGADHDIAQCALEPIQVAEGEGEDSDSVQNMDSDDDSE